MNFWPPEPCARRMWRKPSRRTKPFPAGMYACAWRIALTSGPPPRRGSRTMVALVDGGTSGSAIASVVSEAV